MRAAYYEQFGGPDVVEVGERPEPSPKAEQLLVRIRATGVGRWDVKQMRGAFGALTFPVIPGYEVAGLVETAPPESGFAPGDEVFGHLAFPGGGWAERAALSPERAARKPQGASFAEAAGLIVGAGTAYEGLVDRAVIQPGERVLITAASGGVGTSAVQIAAARGARVLAVAGTGGHALLHELGASATYDYHDPRWVDAVRQDAPNGADVLFDGAGGDTRDRAVALLRPHARAVFIVDAAAPDPPPENVEVIAFSAYPNAARLQAIATMVEQGLLRPIMDSTFPLAEAREAVEHVAGEHSRGRVALTIE